MPSPQRHLSVSELSQRASTGLAIRKGQVKISDPIPASYVHNGAEMDGAYEQPQPTPKLEATWPRRSDTGAALMPPRDDGVTQPVHVSKFTERTSLGPSLAASNMSSTASKDSSLQRRNTGFRATIRRMFSSKRDKNSLSTGPATLWKQQPAGYRPSPLHYSTLPQTRALHPHAPSPHLRGESESILRPEPPVGQLGMRRNTEPSLQLPQCEQVAERGRDTMPSHDDAEVEVEGGVMAQQQADERSSGRPWTAIKRHTPPPIQVRRRSRSADALADLLRSSRIESSDRRDRAEEIAFWRQSIVADPLPPLPNPERLQPVESLQSLELQSDPTARPSRPSIEPVQSFDFGLDDSSGSARPSNLQDRVNTLEVKLVDFEYALAKLQGFDVTKPNLPRRPPRRKTLRGAFPDSGDSSAHDSSSTNDASFLSTPSDWAPPTSPRQRLADRSSKATTIKPMHRRNASTKSEMSIRSSIRFTRDEYDTLRALIEGETSARQQLEIQVMNLQKEVDILKSPIYAYIRPTKYPTPSPDSAREPSTLVTPRPVRRSPPLPRGRDLNETSRFSMSETEPETEGDDARTEVYETPQESHFTFDTSKVSPPGMI